MGELSALPSGTKTGVWNTISAPSDTVPSIEWTKGQKQLERQSGSSPILWLSSCALQFTGHRISPCNFIKFLLAIGSSGLPKQSVHSKALERVSRVLCRSRVGGWERKRLDSDCRSVKSEPWETQSLEPLDLWL